MQVFRGTYKLAIVILFLLLCACSTNTQKQKKDVYDDIDQLETIYMPDDYPASCKVEYVIDNRRVVGNAGGFIVDAVILNDCSMANIYSCKQSPVIEYDFSCLPLDWTLLNTDTKSDSYKIEVYSDSYGHKIVVEESMDIPVSFWCSGELTWEQYFYGQSVLDDDKVLYYESTVELELSVQYSKHTFSEYNEKMLSMNSFVDSDCSILEFSMPIEESFNSCFDVLYEVRRTIDNLPILNVSSSNIFFSLEYDGLSLYGGLEQLPSTYVMAGRNLELLCRMSPSFYDFNIIQEDIEIIPIENVLDDVLGIIGSNYSTGVVCYIELGYVPFERVLDDGNIELFLIPVWKIDFCVSDTNNSSSLHSLILNANNGEMLSII